MSSLTRPVVPYAIRARKQMALYWVTRHADWYRAIPAEYRHLDPLEQFAGACRRAWRHGATLADVAAAAGITAHIIQAELDQPIPYVLTDPPAVLGLTDHPDTTEEYL